MFVGNYSPPAKEPPRTRQEARSGWTAILNRNEESTVSLDSASSIVSISEGALDESGYATRVGDVPLLYSLPSRVSTVLLGLLGLSKSAEHGRSTEGKAKSS